MSSEDFLSPLFPVYLSWIRVIGTLYKKHTNFKLRHMSNNVSGCYRMLFKMLINCIDYFTVSQNASQCFTILQNTSHCCRLLHDTSQCQMLQILCKVTECFTISQNASHYYHRMLHIIITECFTMKIRIFIVFQNVLHLS